MRVLPLKSWARWHQDKGYLCESFHWACLQKRGGFFICASAFQKKSLSNLKYDLSEQKRKFSASRNHVVNFVELFGIFPPTLSGQAKLSMVLLCDKCPYLFLVDSFGHGPGRYDVVHHSF